MLELLLLTTGLQADTAMLPPKHLDEVVVVARSQGGRRSAKGQVASIDEHLQELNHVQMVRRGAYAWEPTVNNMQTERLSTTIDGMKIFYACTDKMDPVTSYVESSNLQNILLSSGLNGNPQATGNIGGALDLKLHKAGFHNAADHQEKGTLSGSATVGYETNGHLLVGGTDAAYSSYGFSTNGGFFYRHADDYEAGGGRKVEFSQFQKVNAYDNFGLRLGSRDVMEGTVIYDCATNVGYPALNMDVAKAEAIITSLAHRHDYESSWPARWETKVYYNRITHLMDDTERPDVQIHMDMPGSSWTAGAYSLLTAARGRHNAQLNLDGYYNRLFADMTMYPGGAAPMYMVTWPDVGTLNVGVALTDDIMLGTFSSLRLSGKVSWQQQRLNSDEGYKALSVFFPGMRRQYYQLTGCVAAGLTTRLSPLATLTVGGGWGSRAPTVTEAYGYYLNNTFDQYDYIGNPRLSNESAIELNVAGEWHTADDRWKFGLDVAAFFFSDYIIGQFETRLSPMTVGAEGVKVYANLPHATIVNASLTAEWKPFDGLHWTTRLSYAAGHDNEGDALPLISPLAVQSRLSYAWGQLSVTAEVKGHVRQTEYAAKYGETVTPGWTVANMSACYAWRQATLRMGVENAFDKYYATYADWCHIPQKGRNIYLNLSLEL